MYNERQLTAKKKEKRRRKERNENIYNINYAWVKRELRI
jgi:hypothetical protein